MIAVVVVRGGELPAGGEESVAEAGGNAVLVGEGTAAAAAALQGTAIGLTCWEQSGFTPATWADALIELVADHDVVVLPASPDGRDLAPFLARALQRPLVTGAVAVGPGGATVAGADDRFVDDLVIDGPFVATVRPGCRGTRTEPGRTAATVRPFAPVRPPAVAGGPQLLATLPADPATMDLAEAARIVGGGAGVGSAAGFDALRSVGLALGAATGATRVVTDWGWAPERAQIGTTGVSVNPQLYVAFGISGAVQHVTGLGRPDHVIAVNTDGSCPMMALADLAVVADAPAVIAELASRLGVSSENAERPDRTGTATPTSSEGTDATGRGGDRG